MPLWFLRIEKGRKDKEEWEKGLEEVERRVGAKAREVVLERLKERVELWGELLFLRRERYGAIFLAFSPKGELKRHAFIVSKAYALFEERFPSLMERVKLRRWEEMVARVFRRIEERRRSIVKDLTRGGEVEDRDGLPLLFPWEPMAVALGKKSHWPYRQRGIAFTLPWRGKGLVVYSPPRRRLVESLYPWINGICFKEKLPVGYGYLYSKDSIVGGFAYLWRGRKLLVVDVSLRKLQLARDEGRGELAVELLRGLQAYARLHGLLLLYSDGFGGISNDKIVEDAIFSLPYREVEERWELEHSQTTVPTKVEKVRELL